MGWSLRFGIYNRLLDDVKMPVHRLAALHIKNIVGWGQGRRTNCNVFRDTVFSMCLQPYVIVLCVMEQDANSLWA